LISLRVLGRKVNWLTTKALPLEQITDKFIRPLSSGKSFCPAIFPASQAMS